MGKTVDFNSESYLSNSKKRFLEKIHIKDNGCWLWIGVNNDKYGILRFKGKNYFAHRLAFFFFKGDEAIGKFVCHTCDNPLCVNPDHLFLGTHADNMKDAAKKKRMAYGEKCGHNKLKEKDIEEIRILVKSGLSQIQISEIFNVEQTNISLIMRGKNWKYSDSQKYDPEFLIKCLIIVVGEKQTHKILKFYEKAKEIY